MPLVTEDLSSTDQQLERITRLYFRVKEYIISSERFDPEGRLSIPAINELRNSYDHQMRVKRVMILGIHDAPEAAGLTTEEYCANNLSKAIGHLYRAGYDALDIISLSLIHEIQKTIAGVERTTLMHVISEYTKEIRTPFNKAIQACNDAKSNKDVESPDTLAQHFEKFETAIETLREIHEKLYQSLEDVQAIDADKRRKINSERFLWGIALVTSIILGILALVF